MSLYLEEIKRIKNLLQEMERGSKKALGQNFLVNSKKIEEIIVAARELKPESVVEVGPGLGALTLHLKESFPQLKVLELDDQFADYWEKQGLHVVRGDALQMNWHQLGLKDALLVSNLPYQISSRLVVERSIDMAGLKNMILMFQKEVAQRITAKPSTSEYGFLTVIAQTFWKAETFADLGPNDFFPPPKVASRVVTFTAKDVPELDGRREAYLKFVKLAFSQKRKMLKKSLLSLVPVAALEKAFDELGIALTARPENVTVTQYVPLYLKLSEVHK